MHEDLPTVSQSTPEPAPLMLVPAPPEPAREAASLPAGAPSGGPSASEAGAEPIGPQTGAEAAPPAKRVYPTPADAAHAHQVKLNLQRRRQELLNQIRALGPFTSAADAQAALDLAARAVALGAITPQIANAMSKACDTWLRGDEARQHEQRLEAALRRVHELEQQLQRARSQGRTTGRPLGGAA